MSLGGAVAKKFECMTRFSANLGHWKELQMQGPSGLLCLSGGDSTWQLEPVEGRRRARTPSSREARQLRDELPSPVPGAVLGRLRGHSPPAKALHEEHLWSGCLRPRRKCSVLEILGSSSAKYAISLKQWGRGGGERQALWFIYLFPVAVENFSRSEREARNWPHLPIMNQH